MKFERLEPRRLLAFTPLAPAVDVPGSTGATEFGLVVADDGSSFVTIGADDGATRTLLRYSADGQQVGTRVPLSAMGSNPSLAIEPDGDAVMAYVNTDGGVEVRRISRGGVLGLPLQVAAPPAPLPGGEQFLKSVVVSTDDAGGFFVGWISDVTHESGLMDMTVHIRAYGADNAPRGPEIVVATASGLTTTYGGLSIAALRDGSGAVFAFDHFGDLPAGIFVGRVSETARVRLEPLRHEGIHELNGGPVAMYDDGSYLVAYAGIWPTTPGGPLNGFVQRFSAADEPQGAPILLDESIEFSRLSGEDGVLGIDVAPTPDGGFVTAFAYQVGMVATPDYVVRLYARRFDAAGAGDPAGPVLIDTIPGANVNYLFDVLPQIDADDEGRVIVGHADVATAPVRLSRFLAIEDFVLEDGVLRVSGTGGADAVNVTGSGSDIIIIRNGTMRRFAAADVDAISIDAFGGDDTIVNDTALPSTILGGAGNDKLLGGSAADSLSGGDGKDKLLGREGKDSLAGNAGNDTLEGGLQADRLAGHGGRDRLYGNGGNDRLFGGAQGDWLYGQGGSDQLNGEGGNDRLYGDHPTGVDTLYGGAGDDLLVARDALADDLFGGRGNDTAIIDEDEDVLAGIETVA
jgi:Ca2+-binding RTX toxin-like protein